MKNLDKFNELSATIFSSLYESFPIGVDIEIEKFPEYNTAENSDLFFETIKFYIDEGFLKCKKQVYGSFLGLRLTSKGFSVLNEKPPEKLSSKINIADALKEVAETGKIETIKSLISQTIKLGFTLINS